MGSLSGPSGGADVRRVNPGAHRGAFDAVLKPEFKSAQILGGIGFVEIQASLEFCTF